MARQASFLRSVEQRAVISEIEIRATAKMGELLKEMPKANGTKGQLAGRNSSGGSRRQPPEDDTPTLADFGITKAQSHRAQMIASIPAKERERYIATYTTGPPSPDHRAVFVGGQFATAATGERSAPGATIGPDTGNNAAESILRGAGRCMVLVDRGTALKSKLQDRVSRHLQRPF